MHFPSNAPRVVFTWQLSEFLNLPLVVDATDETNNEMNLAGSVHASTGFHTN